MLTIPEILEFQSPPTTCLQTVLLIMPMTNSEIADFSNTQSLTSCHEPVILDDNYNNSDIANISVTINTTPIDNMLAGNTASISIDNVHMTSSEAEASSQTHIMTTFYKTHAFNVTPSNILPSCHLH